VAAGALPHEDASIVRGVLRQRLYEYLAAQPEALQDADPIDRSRLPQTPAGEPSAPPEAVESSVLSARKWEWIEQQLTALAPQIVQPSLAHEGANPRGLVKRIATGCAFCHEVDQASDANNWSIVPTRIPSRWMISSRFRHAAHEQVDCNACHYADSSPTTASSSSSSDDILLPARQSCIECHSSTSSNSVAGSARTGCVECHAYHGRGMNARD
jgi:hypothetical protein